MIFYETNSTIKLIWISIIISGSPADKADLEVADEILEINGESLENSSHTDVISHIHNVSILSVIVLFIHEYCVCLFMRV